MGAIQAYQSTNLERNCHHQSSQNFIPIPISAHPLPLSKLWINIRPPMRKKIDGRIYFSSYILRKKVKMSRTKSIYKVEKMAKVKKVERHENSQCVFFVFYIFTIEYKSISGCQC